MEQLIEEILRDLYALDKDLIIHDKQLKEAIKKIINSKPDTRFDENFKLRLKNELLLRIEQIKEARNVETERKRGRIARNFFQSLNVRRLLFVPVAGLALLLIFLANSQYQKNGGIFLTKQNASFSLSPVRFGLSGVEADSGFILKSSKNLPVKSIEKIVAFEPKVDFSVRKIKKTVSFLPSALAVDEADINELPYQYEIKTKDNLREDALYKISIQSEQIADRDYQWAFQIKAPFGASAIVPRNKSTSVPTNTGIEIQFNRQLPENFKDYFSISPNVEGQLEKKYDKIYFHPKGLAEGKLYKVTIKKGLKSKSDDEILKEDYVLAFETSKNYDNENKNEFSLGNSVTPVTPNIHPLVNISYRFDTTEDEYELNLYNLGGADDFIKSYVSSKDFDSSWSSYSKDKNIDEYKPKEDRKIFSAKAKLIDTNNGVAFEIPRNLEEGYYFYEIKNGDVKKAGWIASSKIAHYYTLATENGFFWTYNFSENKNLENAKLSLVTDEERELGQINQDGTLKFDIPKEMKRYAEDGARFFKISAKGEKPIAVLIEDYYSSDNNFSMDYWNYLSTDKNQYKTKDAINFWGILKGRKENIRGKKLTVGLYDNCYRSYYDNDEAKKEDLPFVSEEIIVSDFDTLGGKISFEDMSAGGYCLVIKDTEQDKIFSSKYISIEKYDKPAYQIVVDSSKKAVFAGEEVTFKVKASFYDGTPLSNNELKYRINSTEGKIKLNEFGEAELKYATELEKENYYYPQYLNATFSPSLAEEGDIRGDSVVLVFGPNINIDSSTKRLKDGKFEIKAELKDIVLPTILPSNMYQDGNYLGNQIGNYSMKAKLVKITNEKKETGEYYDYITKTTQKIYEYKQKEDEVDEFTGKTDDAGNWKITKEFEVSQDVSYRVEFEASDKQGRVAKSSTSIYYMIGNREPLTLEMDGGMETDRFDFYDKEREFSVGEKIKLNLKTNPEDKSINNKTLFLRYQKNIEEAYMAEGNELENEFQNSFSPSVNYIGVILTQYGFQESNSKTATFKEADKNIDLNIKFEKENYRPGEEAKVKIIAKDKEGKPISAEINVSVVDEALFQNNSDWNENVLSGLYNNVSSYLQSHYVEYASRKSNDGRGGGGGGERSIFLDVPHYATLKSDESGIAETSFKLPDNLTGWRVMARAFDTNQMVAGQSHSIISTSLPFFVDATLSQEYLVGDKPELKMRFFGKEYDSNQEVEYTVSSPSLKIEQKSVTKNSLNYLSLGALPSGEHEIKISAKQGEKSDTLIRKISVSFGSVRKKDSRTYDLTTELGDILGNENGYTKLMFVDQGKARFFAALSENASEMGARLDQYVASHLSKKLLAEKYFNREFSEDLVVDQYINYSEQSKDIHGLSLLAYSNEDLELSAKVIDGAPKATNLKDFFNQAMYDDKADIHRIAKALYGLASSGEIVLNKIDSVKSEKDSLTLEDKIYLALAEAKSGDIEGARNYFKKEISGNVKNENDRAWIEKDEGSVEKEKLTANLGMLVAYIGEKKLSENIWRYLEINVPQRDLIVLEKSLMAKAELAKITYGDASFTLKTNKRTEKFTLNKDTIREINLSKDELASVNFSDIQGKASVISLFETKINLDEIKNSANLKLTRVYKLGEASSTKFAEGDVVKVSLTPQISNSENNYSYQMIDVLPSGLKLASAESFNEYLINKSTEVEDRCNALWYPSKIDGNRVTFSIWDGYAKENKCKNFSINYYARVVSKGIFKADSAILQSTSDFNQYYILPSGQVEIR